MNMIIFWLFIIVGFAVFEAITPGMVAICFSIAGIAALIVALLGFGLIAQIIVYTIVLAICMYYLIPVLRRLAKINVDTDQQHVKTNLDLVIGTLGEALSDVSFLNDGLVKVDGKEWTAKVMDENIHIYKGEIVRVKRIEGSKIVIEKEHKGDL